jgi:hypothetical protein
VSDQLALVGPATPPDLKLTARQRFALEFIAHRPVSSEELGAALHEYRGAHPAQRPCRWCEAEGAGMGARLRQDGLVRFARYLKVWYLAEQGRPKALSGSQTDDIPF